MGVAVVTEAADTAALAAEDTRVSAAAAMRVELVVATAEPGLVMVVPAMARGHYSPGISTGRYGGYSGYGQRHYAPRSSTGRPSLWFPARDRKIEPLPSSLLGRQGILVATTSHEINRLLALRANPASSNALAQLQKVQPGPASTWSRQNAANKQRLDPQTKERLRNWQGKAPGWNDAKRNHHDNWRDRHHHDHDWWRHHCDAIVFVGWRFLGLV